MEENEKREDVYCNDRKRGARGGKEEGKERNESRLPGMKWSVSIMLMTTMMSA